MAEAPTFAIRGRFDLDEDGHPDESDGLLGVEALVRQLGGRVVPNVDDDTDYVVLGEEPPVPVQPPAGADAATVEEYLQRLRDFNVFRGWIASAERGGVQVVDADALRKWVERGTPHRAP